MIHARKLRWCARYLATTISIVCGVLACASHANDETKPRAIKIALVQFDSRPEEKDHNLAEMRRLTCDSVNRGARWVVFHELSLNDYTPRLTDVAESVPSGPSCQRMIRLAAERDCVISFGMSERDGERLYITQVFVDPKGLIYKYRKSWLWHGSDEGYRNEWQRYDTGRGPEHFYIDGIRATCFICADGDAPRCIERAKLARPEVVFYPNNRTSLSDYADFRAYVNTIGAPMLVTNRVGKSWDFECEGGSVAFDAGGRTLATANRLGNEEVLCLTLTFK